MAIVRDSITDQIEKVQLNDRLLNMRKMFFEKEPSVSSERATLAMNSWKETEGEPLDLRHAKKTAKILHEISIAIHPGEILVGNNTRHFRVAHPHVDFDGSLLDPLMAEGKITLGGPAHAGIVSKEDWVGLEVAGKYFKEHKTACDACKEARRVVMGTWYDEAEEAGATQRGEHGPPFEPVPLWEKLFAVGLNGTIKEAQDHIEEFKNNREFDLEKVYFWQAAIIVAQAVIDFGKRFSVLARKMALEEKDPKRRAELEQIAATCEWVPGNPPRTFREALQLMLFIDAAEFLEQSASGLAGWGTVDQDLYPFFKNDFDQGRMTVQEACEFAGLAIVYLARHERVVEIKWRDYIQTGSLCSLALTGLTKDGEDATNELTYVWLHMAGLLRFPEPHVVFRWHKGVSPKLLTKAIDTNSKALGGIPQFQNSDHIVAYHIARGKSPEAARSWVSWACSQAPAGDERTSFTPTYFNIALIVDMVLHNGVASATKKKLGIETGDPRNFQTFDQLYAAFKKQCEFMMRKLMWHCAMADTVKGKYWRAPLASAVAPGCLEKGKDFNLGGLPGYTSWVQKERGFIPAADSLIAMKKLVFETRKLTMAELIDALDSNFAGERGEEIRQMCLAAPKYGNDIQEVDELVRDIGKFTASIIFSVKNMWGVPYAINRNGQSWHFQNGKKLAALPNGRRAKDVLADGSLSPMQGMDVSGPTAVLRSALTADFKESVAGILNMRFPGYLFKSPEGQEKLAQLTDGFLRAGGTYIQYNLVDRKTLLDAKAHPEKYKDLVVRVGGYSAYFIHLSPEVQDEIIRRTEQTI